MLFKQWLCLLQVKGIRFFALFVSQNSTYLNRESIQENSATVAATDIVLFIKSNYFLHL